MAIASSGFRKAGTINAPDTSAVLFRKSLRLIIIDLLNY
jgi:hypothetical protein